MYPRTKIPLRPPHQHRTPPRTREKGERNARVVDLGLDERRVIEVSLGSNLESDVASRVLGVPDGLGSSLDVLVDLVVVGSGEDAQVGESVQGDGVRGSGVAESDGVAGDGTGGDRVGRLGSEEESIAADDLSRRAESVRAFPRSRSREDARHRR